MSEAVYRLDDVRLKALAYLRKHGASTVEQIATGLGLPDWAIRPALEAAYFADQVHYLQAAEREVSMPSLFDLEDLKEAA